MSRSGAAPCARLRPCGHDGHELRCAGRRATAGQATVEFALVGPLLFFLLFGIVQFGILMAQKSALTFATRQATRAASILGPNSDDQVCAAIRQGLFSSNADPNSLSQVIIFRANPGDILTSNPTDNPTLHDVGTCTGSGTWQPKTDPNLTIAKSYHTYRPRDRNVIVPTDRIGVSIQYNFHFAIPLFGTGFTIGDADILQIEPQYPKGIDPLNGPTPAPTDTPFTGPTTGPAPSPTLYPTNTPLPTLTPYPTSTPYL